MSKKTQDAGKNDLRNALYAYALTLTTGNMHQAQELLHETLLSITHRATSHATTTSLISNITANMRDINQHPTQYTDIEELSSLCYNGKPFDSTAYTTQETMHAMSRLTPHQATVVTLRLKGYTPQEIADTTGHSTAWVQTNLTKACQCLKTIWSN